MNTKTHRPVSQFITDKGCLIQGVMMNMGEINHIYCPTHKKIEHVYSFKREIIDFRKTPTKTDKQLIKTLQSGFYPTEVHVK